MEDKAILSFFLILLIVFAPLSAMHPVEAVEVVGSIDVRATSAWAYNPDRGEMWMAYSVPYITKLGMNVTKTNSVVVISATDYSVIANITIGEGSSPTAIAYDEEKDMMFIANTNFHTVSVVSASNFTILATRYLPSYQTISALSDIKYNPRKGEILVLDYFDGTLTVISDSTLKISRTVNLGNDPYPARLSLSDVNGAIFVGHVQKNKDSKLANYISVLDDQTFELIATIPLSSNGSITNLESGKDVLYAVNGGAISFISTTNYSVMSTVPFGFSDVSDLAYDSAKDVLFVTNPNNNSISIISARTRALIETVTLEVNPLKIEYIPDRGELYLKNSGEAPLILSDASLPDPIDNNLISSPTPAPSIPEFSLLITFPLLIFAFSFSIIILYRKISRHDFNNNGTTLVFRALFFRVLNESSSS